MALEHLNNYDKAIINNFFFSLVIYICFLKYIKELPYLGLARKEQTVPSGSHHPESLDSSFENLMVYYFIIYSQAEGDLGWKYLFLKLNSVLPFSHCTKPFLLFFTPSGYSAEFQVKHGFWYFQVYHLWNDRSYHFRRHQIRGGYIISNLTEWRHFIEHPNRSSEAKLTYATLCRGNFRSETIPE